MKRSITLKTSKKSREFLTETSDREIYQAIMDAIEAGENIDINGGDNIDGVPLDTQPTRWDVIKAVFTIHKYIGDLNDPIAQNLEVYLASFNMNIHHDRIRCMKNILLTDIFFKVLISLICSIIE